VEQTPRIGAFPQYTTLQRRILTGMKAALVGLATTLLLWGGSGLAAPSAEAAPCPAGKSCMTWCPGDPNPAGRPVPWDTGVCHDYYWDYYGVHDIGTGAFYKWNQMGW
jgi:hypothetical protein